MSHLKSIGNKEIRRLKDLTGERGGSQMGLGKSREKGKKKTC